jgi:hypothetical protein
MKKRHSFIAGLASLLGIYFTTLFISPELINTIGPPVILGIVGGCGFYQGANVADNWQRSKHYRPELDKKE